MEIPRGKHGEAKGVGFGYYFSGNYGDCDMGLNSCCQFVNFKIPFSVKNELFSVFYRKGMVEIGVSR